MFNFKSFYLFSYSRNAELTFVENPQLKKISFIIIKSDINSYLIIQSFSEYRELSSLHGWSLEITLTVPLRYAHPQLIIKYLSVLFQYVIDR